MENAPWKYEVKTGAWCGRDGELYLFDDGISTTPPGYYCDKRVQFATPEGPWAHRNAWLLKALPYR